jgi:putative zinc finger/helix-turn-helix YgiT family protein
MRSCVHCGNQEFRKSTETLTAAFPVSGVTASVAVAGEQCTRCRQAHVPPSVVQEFELAVACELAGRGVCTGEAVRHMRKVLGLRAADLARLLDLTPETISHWETGKARIGRAAFVVLGAMVQDALDGRSSTRERLAVLDDDRPRPKVLRPKLR